MADNPETDECAPAFIPGRDPPATLYGFALSEWMAAAARFGEAAAMVVEHWEPLTRAVMAGQTIGISSESFLALAQVSPSFAKRIVARFELPALASFPDVESILAEWVAKAAASGEAPSPEAVDSWRVHLAQQVKNIREIRRLAEASELT